MEKLLSIIVPTKDRYYYLKSLIKIFLSYNQKNTELVIQDNSYDNATIISYLNEVDCGNLHYYYEANPLSVVENMDRALSHASGKYVCVLGDDDFYSRYLEKFTEYVSKRGIESVIFSDGSVYFWPKINFVAHPFPNLILQKPHNRMVQISSEKERNKCIKKGAVNLGFLPRVYHGIVTMDLMRKIYEQTGTYFPGASPDMASSVALSFYVRRHYYCELPLIISGKSPKSVGGKRGRHPADEIGNVNHLPKDIEMNWPSRIPKLWSAGTIWAQSLFEAMGRLGKEDQLKKFNYAACYANVTVFEPAYRKKVFPLLAGNCFLTMQFLLECFWMLLFRINVFVKNFALCRLHLTNRYIKNEVNSSYDAAKVVDEYIKNIRR